MKDFEIYKNSGVDIQKGQQFVNQIKSFAQKTYQKGVLGHLGAFASFFELNPLGYQNPILVTATDGVGTKLLVAQKANNYKNIGIDLVGMCVNDVIVHGAKPLFFLDYLAMNHLDTSIGCDIVQSIADGCLLSECSLVGGETAEMPDLYQKKDFDIAGFCVGIVEKEKIITGQNIVAGDILIGIPSSGLHSNGFSLVRKIIFEEKNLTCNSTLFDNISVAEELLKATKIYVKTIKTLLSSASIKGMAHITGGGLYENIPRILPQNLTFRLKKNSWPFLSIFQYIQKEKKLSRLEMEHIFNCGIGMALVVSSNQVDRVQNLISSVQENSYVIGDIVLA